MKKFISEPILLDGTRLKLNPLIYIDCIDNGKFSIEDIYEGSYEMATIIEHEDLYVGTTLEKTISLIVDNVDEQHSYRLYYCDRICYEENTQVLKILGTVPREEIEVVLLKEYSQIDEYMMELLNNHI